MHIKTLSIFKIITLTIAITTGLSFVYADWTVPSAPPLADTIFKPVNVGITPQTKTGLLKLNSGLKIGLGNTQCNENNLGKIHWQNLSSAITTVDGRLEVCSRGNSNTFEWKILQDSINSCTVTQESMSCNIPGFYACNCSKSGCDSCETQDLTYACNCGKDGCQECSTGAQTGVQFRVTYSCSTQDLQTDWSICEPCTGDQCHQP